MSPFMGFWLGAVAVLWIPRLVTCSVWIRRAVPVATLLLFFLLGAKYNETYGHFGELLTAKIVHMNEKPEDPSVLTYNQRIMWTPALHSANWNLTKEQFPSTLILSLVGMAFFIIPRSRDKDFKLLHPIFCCLFSLGAFILFFRFHVFVIIYMAVIIGGWAALGFRSPGWRFYGITLALMVGFGVELFSSSVRPPVPMNKLQHDFLGGLVDWLEEHADGKPVLANFGVSGSILAYAGCPVILHPKFETADIRDRVREYGEALFKKSEKELKQWADQHGAEYLVFSRGEFYPEHINLQMRYMVDAVTPAPDAAASKFFWKTNDELNVQNASHKRALDRDFLRYFKFEWCNEKYTVFKIVTDNDEEMAAEQVKLAQMHLKHGNMDDARKWAVKAIEYDFLNEDAFWVLEKSEALKRKGFQSVVP
jgi:hypothetical protein